MFKVNFFNTDTRSLRVINYSMMCWVWINSTCHLTTTVILYRGIWHSFHLSSMAKISFLSFSIVVCFADDHGLFRINVCGLHLVNVVAECWVVPMTHSLNIFYLGTCALLMTNVASTPACRNMTMFMFSTANFDKKLQVGCPMYCLLSEEK